MGRATNAGGASAAAGLRRVLLAIVVFGAAGLLAELLLLEHYEDWKQWIPLILLGGTILSAGLLWLREGAATLRLFRVLMVACLLAGVVGTWLHFASNRAFELEMEASQGGWLLVWHALRGATPALAPGALLQLGLIGLALTWRHPAARARTTRTGKRSR